MARRSQKGSPGRVVLLPKCVRIARVRGIARLRWLHPATQLDGAEARHGDRYRTLAVVAPSDAAWTPTKHLPRIGRLQSTTDCSGWLFPIFFRTAREMLLLLMPPDETAHTRNQDKRTRNNEPW